MLDLGLEGLTKKLQKHMLDADSSNHHLLHIQPMDLLAQDTMEDEIQKDVVKGLRKEPPVCSRGSKTLLQNVNARCFNNEYSL